MGEGGGEEGEGDTAVTLDRGGRPQFCFSFQFVFVRLNYSSQTAG